MQTHPPGKAQAGHTPEAEDIGTEERERIRQGLKRYKALQGNIGDVRLWKRISRAINKVDIDQSTLQRFLRGKHRTDDEAVRDYRLFLRMVAPPPAEDELGRSLRTFMPGFGGMPIPPGTYRSLVRRYQGGVQEGAGAEPKSFLKPKFGMMRAHGKDFAPACSVFIMTPRKEGYVRVKETMDLKDAERDEDSHPVGFGFGSTGVLLSCHGRKAVMMMRSFMDSRFYLLNVISEKPFVLRGVAYEPGGDIGRMQEAPNESWQPAFEIALACMTNDKKP